MITFGAKYLSPVNIGEIKDKSKVVPYQAAMTEFTPDDMRDLISLNFLANFSIKRTKFANTIFENFSDTIDGKLYDKNWVRYLAITKEQDSYKYVKTRNILGLAEISSTQRYPNEIYLNYLQTVKNWFVQKYCFVGTSFLDYIKETYPDENIVLQALKNTVNFYKDNGFVVTNNLKANRLVEMKYFHK